VVADSRDQPHQRAHSTNAGTVTTTHGLPVRRARNALAVPVPFACEAAQPPKPLTKPFWDACNERRLVVQHCTACARLHYPPTQRCNKCGSADTLEWKEVQGKGHIDVYFVIRDSRIRGFRSAQPINFAVITLDEDPGINFLSNLPGTPPGEVPVGAPVELIFEQTSTGQMVHEWRVVT
jgi:uncharacterized OB-fold protein